MDLRLRNKKALIFDMDGVIIDSNAHWASSTSIFLRNHGVDSYSIKEVMELCTGLTLAEGAKRMQTMFGFSGDPEELAHERREIISDLYRYRTRFRRGFKAYFYQVQDRGLWDTCVATSCDTHLLDMVDEALQLRQMFSGKVYSVAMVGNKSKPDPAIFQYSANELGIDPHDCFVIEDSINGVKAAKSAGMFCVGIVSTTSGYLLLEAGADLLVREFHNMLIDPNS